MTEKTTFTVDSSLLLELGERLVANRVVALAELVKNAYDADATHVAVTFQDIHRPGGIILIEDNGHGMTATDFHNGWMRIGTTYKAANSRSRNFGRVLTGEKGIGRFAARRLGRRLELQTTAFEKGELKTLVARFDWDDFTRGQDVQEIGIEFNQFTARTTDRPGTKLLISNMPEVWTADDLDEVRNDLFSLQSPFPDLIRMPSNLESTFNSDPGFTIDFEIIGSDELAEFSGSLGDEFARLYWAQMDGEIDDLGRATYRIKVRTEDQTEEFYDDVELYSEIPNVSFRILYIDRETGSRSPSFVNSRTLSKKGRNDGGVRVYLDGFRVYPYGNPGNDWLENDRYAAENIDMAARIVMSLQAEELNRDIRSRATSKNERPFLLMPKNNSLFGAVTVSREGPSDFSITSSREGFVENATYGQLKRFLQRGLYWLTLIRASKTLPAREARRELRTKATTAAESLQEVVKDLRDIAVRSATPFVPEQAQDPELDSQENVTVSSAISEPTIEQRLVDVAEKVTEATAAIEAEREALTSDIAMLRVLATAGTSLLIMQHQMTGMKTGLTAIFDAAKGVSNLLSDNNKSDGEKLLQKIGVWRTTLDGQLKHLEGLLAPENRDRRQRLAIAEVVNDAIKPFDYHIEQYNIKVTNDVPPFIRTPPMFYAELFALILNLVTNALKAVHDYPDRQIRFFGARPPGAVILEAMNTGKRVSPQLRDIYFRPFQNDRNEISVFGKGTGLGMTMIRDIAETYDGTAEFIDVEEPWQTAVRVTLPIKGN